MAAALLIFLAIDPFQLVLGRPVAAVRSELDLRFHRRGDQLVARSVEVFPAIFDSQDLVLRSDAERRLGAVHVQIVPDEGATGSDVLRLFDGVRAELRSKFGAPAWERREGEARGEEILGALERGEVVRLSQWDTPAGAVRCGIPRRVDGRVIVEMMITKTPPPRGELFWGAE